MDRFKATSKGKDTLGDKTYKKHLMYFTGCPSHLGCTVMLRGGTDEELKRIKNVVKFMVFVLYNWKFERSYLIQERVYLTSRIRDGLMDIEEGGGEVEREEGGIRKAVDSSPSSPVTEVIEDDSDPLRSKKKPKISTTKLIVDKCLDNTETNAFKQALNDAVICCSPYVNKSLPFLESDEGKQSTLRKYFPQDLFYSKLLEQKSPVRRGKSAKELLPKVESSSLRNLEGQRLQLDMGTGHPLVGRSAVGVTEVGLDLTVADFRSHGGQLLLEGQYRIDILFLHKKLQNNVDKDKVG